MIKDLFFLFWKIIMINKFNVSSVELPIINSIGGKANEILFG
jgi:hypothetical protein